MTLSLPMAVDSPAFDGQAILDACDLTIISSLSGTAPTGVSSGGAVTPLNSGVDLRVAIAAGSATVTGTAVSWAAVASLDPGAASSGDRRDIVVVDNTGTVAFIAGTPCAVANWRKTSSVLGPVKPSAGDKAVLAEVYIPGAVTSITAANIIDKRAVPSETASGVLSYRHVQGVAASTWTVNHGLGYKPGGVYAENSAHDEINGLITHIDTSTLTIDFFVNGLPSTESGEAHIS